MLNRKQERCVNLISRKDNILRIEKTGTKRQELLKEYLDEIIIENKLK